MKFSGVFLSVFLIILAASCGSIPVNYTASESWSIAQNGMDADAEQKTIKVAGVFVDRQGGWDSLEKEIAVLAPLYFWEQGYRQVPSGGDPAYVAHINLREREFTIGWHTRRSLAVEVRIWEGASGIGQADFGTSVPIAAGRIVAIGNDSFSSSQITGKMLSRAIVLAVKKIPLER